MEGQASTWDKFWMIPGLVFTNLVAFTLFTLTSTHWESSLKVVNFVKTHRSAIGIVVQLISHMLGLILVRALCSTINLSARASFAKRSFFLDSVKFLTAICGVHMDWALPWSRCITLLAFITTTLFPAALWAGAITPVPSSRLSTEQIFLPAFTNRTLLNQADIADLLSDVDHFRNTERGIFSYLPATDIQGLLLNSAQDASSRTQAGGTNSHAKLDKTGYVYTGRSYGVGASVGLVDGFTQSVTSYTYNETGFRAATQCIYNDTSAFVLKKLFTPEDWTLQVFDATGYMPNGQSSMFAAAGIATDDIVALGISGWLHFNQTHYVVFATGNGTDGRYGSLSNVQCQVTFEPTEFAISVNVTGLSITVHPLEPAPVPAYASNLTSQAVNSVGDLGSTLATTIWTSVIGDVFMNNIANVEAASGPGNSSNLRGVADAVTSLIDNVFGAYSAAQLMVQNDNTTTSAEAKSDAIVFGSPAYVYPVLVVNLVTCLVYVIEVIRTRGWNHSSSFDFMNITSVIISTSTGGSAIASKVQSLHPTQASSSEAAKKNSPVGKIRVRLRKMSQGRVALTVANDGMATTPNADLAHDWQATDSLPLLRRSMPGRYHSDQASVISEL
ncbi:MAG: hypothetical protein FRX48_01092 [Lasallia pustulata]|uniref:Uncharacterized protein n=1 Tax=Lasallia pustulata TaxID=136370 RepID=A0A5M8Q3W2_9LECA|nr:MAG: hypothetical protein FRX48_01092 [Lasallia pustulata]